MNHHFKCFIRRARKKWELCASNFSHLEPYNRHVDDRRHLTEISPRIVMRVKCFYAKVRVFTNFYCCCIWFMRTRTKSKELISLSKSKSAAPPVGSSCTLSTIHYQLSIINYQLSIINYQFNTPLNSPLLSLPNPPYVLK